MTPMPNTPIFEWGGDMSDMKGMGEGGYGER
jgi:hypothetical protein